ncbi:MAG: DUF892 family protein [Pseudomonadota bacterium]
MDVAPANIRDSETFEIFVTGLKNTHGLQKQSETMLENQIERVEQYSDYKALLTAHLGETKAQIQALETILDRYDENPSALKEGVMSLMAELPTLGHATAQDEILKNAFATFGLAAYTIAAYESLIVMARAAGHTEIAVFERAIAEEEAFLKTARPLVANVTAKYVGLTAADQDASY